MKSKKYFIFLDSPSQHWLRGLCKKGDQCEFLHEYDMSKMPECYFYSRFSKCDLRLFLETSSHYYPNIRCLPQQRVSLPAHRSRG